MSITLPGWTCESCGLWNGTEKDRKACRGCEHPGPTIEGASRQLLIETLFTISRDATQAYAQLTNVQAGSTKLLEQLRLVRAENDALRGSIKALEATTAALKEQLNTALFSKNASDNDTGIGA
jgi:septal ring factor EnvC (AmiA/AmiB activator)